jgi:transposase
MNLVSTLGIDLAKSTFSLHGVDANGAVVLRRSLSRAKLSELVAQLQPCLIGMEACSGAHEWARRFAACGHTVKLMAPKFVTPYRKSGKNDGNDAEAICEAVARPNMRFVPMKSLEQQSDLSLHRVRQGFVEERTATLNRLRGLLAEFGHVLPLRAVEVHRRVPLLLGKLPARVAVCARDLLEHAARPAAKTLEYEHEIETHVRSNALARRTQTRLGIGPITASALVATVVTPGCASTATYRASLGSPQTVGPAVRTRAWANVATVALANRLARIAWATWKHGRAFDGNWGCAAQ